MYVVPVSTRDMIWCSHVFDVPSSSKSLQLLVVFSDHFLHDVRGVFFVAIAC